MEELERVEQAWRASDRVLFVGFNRRFSEPVTMVKDRFAGIRPLIVTYRVHSGEIPEGHWYNDRRQGGRFIGEVCHFIDTCIALVDEAPVSVEAKAAAENPLPRFDDYLVSLRFQTGSLATIIYSSQGHPETEKERLEILGGRHTAIISDFREVLLDNKRIRLHKQDKGHAAQAAALLHSIDKGLGRDEWAIASRTTLYAASQIGG